MIRLGRRFPGASPGKARRLDGDAGWGRDAGPGRDEPGGRGEDALRREERVDAGENDERREPQREPQRQRAVDEPLAGHGREPPGRAPLERADDGGDRRLGTRLEEHRVHEVVVQVGMVAFDRPRGEDEVHAIPHERHDPAHDRGAERDGPTDEPRPPGPRGEAALDEPVIRRDAESEPRHEGDGSPEGERRDGDPLHVGAGGR